MEGDLRGVGPVKLSELYKMIEVLLARHVLPEMQSCLGVSKLGEQVVEKRILHDGAHKKVQSTIRKFF